MKSLVFRKAVATLGLSNERDYQVIDFGCGKGELLALLSEAVGEKSHLVGYDAMEKPLGIAQARLPAAQFICERFVDELPFRDASFDVFMTVDTLECVENKEALLAEIHRVLRPGGQVLAMHWDWDSQIYNIRTRELARTAARAFSDWQQPWMDVSDGQMGRQLWGLFEGSGKFQGTPDAFCLLETEYKAGKYGYDRAQELSGLVEKGTFDAGEYDRFRRELWESSESGEYFYSVTSFIYHGWRV